jgi:hypothetical protein
MIIGPQHKVSYIWFEDTGLIEVEVVDEGPLSNFNPPLIDLEAPLLVKEGDIFSHPFSLFNNL